MSRMIKDFVEIKDGLSLDALIEKLVEVRDSLPEAAEASVRMRGDDVFGRKLSVAFSRPQTHEEAECDARYAHAYRESRQRELDKLQAELRGEGRARRPGKLRIVAG